MNVTELPEIWAPNPDLEEPYIVIEVRLKILEGQAVQLGDGKVTLMNPSLGMLLVTLNVNVYVSVDPALEAIYAKVAEVM